MAVKEVAPIFTPKFRAAFVWIWKGKPAKPRPGEKAKPDRFTQLMLFPPGTDLSGMKAAAKEAALNLWDSKAEKTVAMDTFKGAFKVATSIKNADGDPYFPWAEGYTAVEAWSYQQPMIAGTKEDPTNPGKPEILTVETDYYAGVWAKGKVRAYAYDTRKDGGGFGVNFDLGNIQKLADDEKLGGGAARTNAADDFQPIAADPNAGFMD